MLHSATTVPRSGSEAPTGVTPPLGGVRVLDFSANISGPLGTMLLGDFGADVIKIEAPDGERGRLWGTARFGPRSDMSSLYAAFNRNKRSLSVDLTTDRGREVVYRLVASADVVLENYFPGVAAKLGIDYDQLRRLKNDLIYCRLSGFGIGFG